MTYLQFHLAFVLPPILALALIQPRPLGGVGARSSLGTLGLIVLIALAYTTPWDNYLVWRGVWTYGSDRVIGTIGFVPVEEYLFFLLMPILAGLFYFLVRAYLSPDAVPPPSRFRLLVTGFWVIVALAGTVMLFAADRWLYLGLILAWAAPVLAGMSWLGAEKVWADRRAFSLGIGVPTLYLWFADRTAIALGIWDISDRYSLGLDPLGLPIEEAVFFLLTAWLSVQGLSMLLPSTAPASPTTK